MSRNILKAVAAWKTGFTEQAEWAGLSRKETATLQKSGSGDRHFHRVHVSLWRGSTRKPTGLNLGGLRLPRRRSPVPTRCSGPRVARASRSVGLCRRRGAKARNERRRAVFRRRPRKGSSMIRSERAVLFVGALAAWVLQGRAAAAPGDALYTRPGRIVPAGDGARLNLYCTGNGSPTVVFESGWEDWAPAWAIVQPRIAQWTRACSYDRAGAGFSDPGPMPRTSVRIADELYTALHNAGIAGPYVLVGHAFGGDCVRTFAERYLPEVAG